MSTHKRIDLICIVILLLTLALTLLFMNGEALGVRKLVDEDAEANSDSVYFTAKDMNGDWDTSGATYIRLLGGRVEITGKNAYADGTDVVIKNGGDYVIEGSLTEGSITVDAYRSSKVRILLNGVSVSCADDAAFRVEEADKVFLTLAEGTENSFVSGESFSETAVQEGRHAALFSRDDLTVNGSGTLRVSSGYKHALEANDDLVITGGTLVLESAAGDGIHVNDSLRIMDAALEITAADEGIDVDGEAGWMYMESGSLSISAEGDGIHAEGDILIAGGSLSVESGDDGIHSGSLITVTDGSISIPACYEGLEALQIDISGGELDIRPSDDGINANGGSSTGFGFGRGGEGRKFEGMQTGEFPQPPEEGEFPQPPELPQGDFTQPPELPQGEFAQPPEIPQDGSERQSADGAGAAQSGESTAADSWIRISGGRITIINENGRDADGLDSNGSIFISGGEIFISLPGSGGNCAIDCGSESGGTAVITGGTVIACGDASMAEGLSSASTQVSVMYNTAEAFAAGTQLSLEDAEGTVILSWEVPVSFNSAILSSPEMKIGESYVLTAGETAETLTPEEVSQQFGERAGGGFPGGGFGGGNHMGRGGMRGAFGANAESGSEEAL